MIAVLADYDDDGNGRRRDLRPDAPVVAEAGEAACTGRASSTAGRKMRSRLRPWRPASSPDAQCLGIEGRRIAGRDSPPPKLEFTAKVPDFRGIRKRFPIRRKIFTFAGDELRTASYRSRQLGPRRTDFDRPRDDRNAHFHARGYRRQRQGRVSPRPGGRGGRTDHSGQYLSSVPASGDRYSGESRRPASFLLVGPSDSDRQRRVSGLLAGRLPETFGGRLPLQLAYRRVEASVHARGSDRYPAFDRGRHHDGVRRVSAGRRAVRLCGPLARSDLSLARAVLRPLSANGAEIRSLSVAVPDRAGVRLIPICGPARPSSSGSSTPTAMRSEDWPWANRLR